MAQQPQAENMCFGMLLLKMVILLIASVENMMLKFGLKGIKMRALSERVVFEEARGAEVGVSKVYVVTNRITEEDSVGDVVLRVFATFEDAVRYAEFERDLNELDDYAVIEKEVL